MGGHVINADQFGHEALRQPEIRKQVVARWSDAVLNDKGEVDRRQLGRIVFADAAERRELEGLVFPWIERRIREEIARADADPSVKFGVLDAAILIETGWGRWCDLLAFIDVPRPVRLARLMETRGWSEKEVEAREQAQLPVAEKAARADVVIQNHGEAAQDRQLKDQLEGVVARLLAADRQVKRISE
jgi:dephospho-CoA kinase